MASRVGDGRLTIAATGTEKKLTDGTYDDPAGSIDSVCVQALHGNTDKVVVGAANVIAALATRRGIALAAGEAITLDVDDLQDVYVDAVVNGEGVSFTWVA